ncbi:helix-turn-helix transcriptional regulator [Streptomyces sp. NPDC048659]|uniref:helix-turn-helix domain-containing protein n=1 Tax=Streptomyces sp. NPDC048659 TaxID=3155489 RepID=UPI003417D523
MSHLWSGRPLTVRLAGLDIICEVLDCTISHLLVRKDRRPAGDHDVGGGQAGRRRQPDPPPPVPTGSLRIATTSTTLVRCVRTVRGEPQTAGGELRAQPGVSRGGSCCSWQPRTTCSARTDRRTHLAGSSP